MSFTVMSSHIGFFRSSPSASFSRLSNSKRSQCQFQRRTFWRWTSRDRVTCNDVNRIVNRMREYQRHYLTVLRRKSFGYNGRQQWIDPLYNRCSWKMRRWNTNFGCPGSRRPRRRRQNDWEFLEDPWDIHRARTQQRMEHIKKQVEDDPYTALFGRRLDPFDYRNTRHFSWSELCRAFFGLGHGGKPHESKPTITTSSWRSRSDKDTRMPHSGSNCNEGEMSSSEVSMSGNGESYPRQTTTRTDTEVFEFDPISGRMVPVTPHTADAIDESVHRQGSKPVETTGEEQRGHVDIAGAVNENMEPTDASQRPCSKNVQSSKNEFLPESIITPAPAHQSEVGPNGSAGSYESKPGNMQERNSASDTQSPSKFSAPNQLEVSRNPETPDKIRPNFEEGIPSKSTGKYDSLLGNLHEREKSEDLDLLRASDIRASYEPKEIGKPELDAQKQRRRKALEQDFDSYKDTTANDIRTENIQASSRGQGGSKMASEKPHDPHSSASAEQPLAQRQESPKGDGEQGTRVQAENVKRLESNRVDESPSVADAHQPQTQDLATSKSNQHFAQNEREVETSQPSSRPVELGESATASLPFSPAIYRVLAYDSSTRQITTAEATSSLYSNELSHPTEILSRLNNPAKFLPHFAEMKRDGYEIVSGGGDILVFKKMREKETPVTPADTTATVGASATSHSARNLPGDSVRRELEEDRSEHEPGFRPATNNEAPTEEQSRLIRKQETVYAGGRPQIRSQYPPSPPSPDETIPEKPQQPIAKERGKFRKSLSRMLFTGSATAATCYAVGVVCEYFRTGGEDGRGIDAFTVFESERRQDESRKGS